MVYESPYPEFPQCTVPVHEFVLAKIDEVIRMDPSRKAFINAADSNDAVTYSQLKEQALSVAQFLHARGFVKQIACVVTANCMQFAPLFLGVSLQGGALSGASAIFTEYELRRQFEDSGCTVVVADERNLAKAKKAAKGIAAIKTFIVVGDFAPVGLYSWKGVISTKPDPKRRFPAINVDEDLVLLPYSSGTTGTPKGVMLTHKNYGSMLSMLQSLRQLVLQFTGEDPDTPSDIQLLVLPFYHMAGFSAMIMGVCCKFTQVVLNKFDPHVFCSSIQHYKIKSLGIVPPILVFLAKDPRCDKYDLSSVNTISCGAAATGKSIIEEVRRRYPNMETFRQGYGMTEMSFASHISGPSSWGKDGCCGTLAPGLQMKIIDPSTGQELPEGTAGEICLRGVTVMKGYLGREKETRETLRDGWLHTGDVGYTDSDGDLYIVDRIKELIKVGGLQVAPAELESVLLTHPSVADVAVVGIPDERSGELPKAFVVRSDQSLTEQQVLEFVKDKVSSYKQLRGGVEFVNAIPKSEAGKILRRQLANRQTSKI